MGDPILFVFPWGSDSVTHATFPTIFLWPYTPCLVLYIDAKNCRFDACQEMSTKLNVPKLILKPEGLAV